MNLPRGLAICPWACRFLLLACLLTSRRAVAAEPRVPFPRGARILFQGDSITDGNRGRNEDPNHILGHGYAFLIAAHHGAALPDRGWTFLNRGVSGNTVADLGARWTRDTLDLKPDVLSLLIGVNDMSRGVSVEEFERQYDRLLHVTRAALPRVRLVLCEPFLLPVGPRAEGWEAARDDMQRRQAVVARLARRHGAACVHFQRALDAACQRAPAAHWIWDGIHPTYSGHQVLADAWVRVVQDLWLEDGTPARPSAARPLPAPVSRSKVGGDLPAHRRTEHREP